MATQYEVTAPCVTHIPASTSNGPMLLTLYQGNRLPGGVPEARLQHLLDGNMIRAVEEAAPEPEEEDEDEDEGPDAPPATVNSRSSKADLVAYGVAQGDDRAVLDDMTRDELLDRYVRKQQ